MDKNEQFNFEIYRLKKDNELYISQLKLCQIEKVIIEEPRNLQEKCTLENSILSIYVNYQEFEPLNYALCSWLEDSINIFNFFRDMVESKISGSILPEQMVKQELSSLNQFLESGIYKSKAYHSRLVTEELYELYSRLLFGESWVLIGLDELCAFQDILNNQAIEAKAAFFKESMQDSLKKDWWLSIRLQVLLWMKKHLEKLNENENKKEFTDIFSKYKRQSPFESLSIIKQGFQVHNPEIIPQLYSSLIEHHLIINSGLTLFENSFKKAQGTITWVGGATHGKGVNSLIYLIDRMYRQNLIQNENFIKVTASIFRDTGQQTFKHSSLTQSNSANINHPPRNQHILDDIVDNLKNL